jgi:hypothetical protein
MDEFSTKLNTPNEMTFYVLYGPRSSGKSSFLKTLPPPPKGILLMMSAETIQPPQKDKKEEEQEEKAVLVKQRPKTISSKEESQNVFESLSKRLQCINLPQKYTIPTCKTAQEFQSIFSKKVGVFDCPVGLIIDEYDPLMEYAAFNSMLRDMKHSHEDYWVKVI